MTDLRDESPKLRELYGYLRAIEELRDSEGWAYLVRIARNQQAARRAAILAPLASSDKAYEQEFMKGELAGIETFLGLPDALIESLEQDIEIARARESEEEKELNDE